MASGSDTEFSFPALIGGVPLPIDFAPAILFSILYGLLTPVVLYRLIHKRSRTTVLVGTGGFVIERTVAYALRAHAAHNAGFRASHGLEIYLQVAINAGFITIGQDTLALLRALLVDATFGKPPPVSGADASDTTFSLGALPRADAASASHDRVRGPSTSSGGLGDLRKDQSRTSVEPLTVASERPGFERERADMPRARQHIRSVCGIAALVFLAVVVMSIIAGVDYRKAVDSGEDASQVQVLRYASSGITLFLLVCMICGALYAIAKTRRVPRRPVALIVALCVLLTIVAVYRLIVMRNWTTSLLSTAPGSQNTAGAKAAWWVFHATPELIASALLLSVNLRQWFKTGPFGDLTSEKPATVP
ncbi:hypothetical protein PYCCODRAFT_1472566 [Trametes coccinea BRFM310]|uniref:Uncharacterized protein n=1 Tax=Trametes coccinea (strain BRFM310) TaxID=1353009 RepID=A0A1Y2I5V2_TRAC3|nr:hypothetical protein PYCCODRAFT_1472566 [Trametes coccinea BRFM310]